MSNSADPDQLASEEANWSGSTLFAKAGYIRVQQDKGLRSDREKHIQNYYVFLFPGKFLVQRKFQWPRPERSLGLMML